MEFRSNLRRAMDAADVTPDALAVEMTRLGVPVQGQTVRLWLRGRAVPRAHYMPALVRALGCEYDSLFPLKTTRKIATR